MLEQLLQLEATELRTALHQAAEMISRAFRAEKVDAWFKEPEVEAIAVIGINESPLSRRERALGLDRLPLANGGRIVGVYQTGQTFRTGRADLDALELPGFTRELGVRSMLAAPLDVAGERRGVLVISDQSTDHFDEGDQIALEAVARWVGMVAHRADLVEDVAQQATEQGRRAAADELVTVVAHDLRNLLTPIYGRLELLHRRATSDGQEQYSQDARQLLTSVKRVQRLIGEVLDVGRIDQGLLTLSKQPTDLVELVRQVAAQLSAPARQVEVRATLLELTALVDPDRMLQVVENLLANAVRHTPEPLPVRIEVAPTRLADEDAASITIVDSGPGISLEVRARLFQRFAAGSATSGLGLGLYLARSIARAHGGDLTLDSPPGEGARFTLVVPVGLDAPTVS
jgi:two-component system OmpR family sensor kinase